MIGVYWLYYYWWSIWSRRMCCLQRAEFLSWGVKVCHWCARSGQTQLIVRPDQFLIYCRCVCASVCVYDCIPLSIYILHKLLTNTCWKAAKTKIRYLIFFSLCQLKHVQMSSKNNRFFFFFGFTTNIFRMYFTYTQYNHLKTSFARCQLLRRGRMHWKYSLLRFITNLTTRGIRGYLKNKNECFMYRFKI